MTLSEPIAILPSLSLDSMEALARSLAKRLKPGDVLTLEGELGSGKTTFARALIRIIALQDTEVTSPTFALMQPYDVELQSGIRDVLWHLDLYRIEDTKELASLGLEELWPHIVLIEWPEIVVGLLPAGATLSISIAFGASQEARTLTFYGNDAWRKRLVELK